jgi:hypothetical protein
MVMGGGLLEESGKIVPCCPLAVGRPPFFQVFGLKGCRENELVSARYELGFAVFWFFWRRVARSRLGGFFCCF